MAKNKKIIKIVKGKTDIFLIAPHGVNVPGVKNDDKRTDILTFKIAKKLKCSALINDSIKRTECDYNSIAEATKDKEFIKNIRSVLDADGPTLVVWLHGMSKKRSLEESKHLGLRGALDCMVGYGQPNRHTAQIDTVNNLVELMNDRCIAALPTADSGYLRGWAKDNMNQWFRQQKEYNDLSKVQSIQLEIREKDFRDSKENIKKTAKIISDMGWVAKQVGHTSFKMIYEHYYRYMKKDDPSDEILAYLASDEKENSEKWSQSGHIVQDVLTNKQ